MQASAAPLVRLAGIRKTYRSGGAETVVLDDAELTLPRAETFSLTGVSGSGKSTLLGLLAGLVRPDAGRILFDGQDLGELDETGRARLRARRIGVVLQSGNLVPFLTAAENVELAVGLAGGSRRGATAVLGRLGLAERLDHLPRRLSGGEAQRVAVAVALANAPDLVLADEVTGELDAANAAVVMEQLLAAGPERGATVLFVTHNADLAGLAQHRLRLAGGRVHAE